MNILLLGSGGREHAIARSLAASPRCSGLWIAPGNAGTATVGRNISIGVNDFGAIREFTLREKIELVVVGPEEPLVRGIVDFFAADPELSRVKIVGPTAKGAGLEGSKAFAKGFMARHGIPTAGYKAVGTVAEGEAFLETLQAPYVLKADGLAAGKGVVIPHTLEEARRELGEMLGGKFGSAGSRVVIEQFLGGIECSVFVATDGRDYRILPTAKDYKRVGEGDTGPNTGGMGAVSPVPFADPSTAAGAGFMSKVEERIVRPTVDGLAAEKIPYKGFIFIGLMNVGGEPWVIEYNVRMGDPETEVVFPRITSDAVDLMTAIASGGLSDYDLRTSPLTAATVVAVSGGYPEAYKKGFPIAGLPPESERSAETIVFHAGTAFRDNKIVTSGGRVLAVTSSAESLPAALKASYAALEKIAFDGIYYRRDIGRDLLREKNHN